MTILRPLVLCLLVPATALAQAPYPTTPSWTSSDTGYSTGIDVSGSHAYVAADGDELHVVRISDPTTPARLDDVGIPHLALRPDRVADVRETIRLKEADSRPRAGA